MVDEIEEEETEPKGGEDKEGEGQTEEKKKKIKKTNLDFTTARPLDWTKNEINKAYEEEVAMANTDHVVRETSNMSNELELCIYDKRDKIMLDRPFGAICDWWRKGCVLFCSRNYWELTLQGWFRWYKVGLR